MRSLALLAGLVAVLAALPATTPAGFAQEPPEPRFDPAVAPAQFTAPGRVAAPGEAAAGVGGAVADPATPVVRIQVRAPAHLAPGKPIVYRILVSNPSAATAYKVVVRHPKPEGVEPAAPKCVPEPPPAQPGATDLTWKFAELKPGATKEITVTYDMARGAASATAKAFVGFEHGQAVTTDRESTQGESRKERAREGAGRRPHPGAGNGDQREPRDGAGLRRGRRHLGRLRVRRRRRQRADRQPRPAHLED